MTMQFSSTMRDDFLQQFEDTLGTTPKLRLYSGSVPANVAATAGTQLLEITLPSDWMTKTGGVATKSGTWSGTVGTGGDASHYRLLTSGGTAHHQGSVSQAFSMATNAITAANSNVLNFADTTGVTTGAAIYGTGVPTGATVLSKTSTTVTMSAVSTAGVTSGATIYFGDVDGDLWLNNVTLAPSQVVTITAWTMTAPGA